jgi:hypothetical protein
MPLVIVPAIIAAGDSLSAGADCGVGELVRFYMPNAWTAANVTFQMSPDGIAYSDMVDKSGREIMISIMPNAGIVVDVQWRALAWLKIRSGTRDKPIAQAAQREFRLIIFR